MNSRQSWLLSCLSEKNCRRCMYRYAWATRTLRAVVARLCLLCMQMSSPIHVLSHRRHSPFSPTPQLVQPFSLTPLPFVLAEGPISARAKLLAVVFVSAEEPISARAKVLFLRVVVCLWHLPLFARSAASSKFAWRGRNAGPRGDVLQSRRRVVTVSPSGMPAGLSRYRYQVGTVCLRPARYRLSKLISPFSTDSFA